MDKDDEPVMDSATSREERRTTGRIVAVIVALLIIILACYHAWVRKHAVLAGVIVPALIMVLYTAWVLYSTKKDKYRKTLDSNGTTLTDVIAMNPLPINNKEDKSKLNLKTNRNPELVGGFKSGDLPLTHQQHHNHNHNHHGTRRLQQQQQMQFSRLNDQMPNNLNTNRNNVILSGVEPTRSGQPLLVNQGADNITAEQQPAHKNEKRKRRSRKPYISFNRDDNKFNRSFSVL